MERIIWTARALAFSFVLLGWSSTARAADTLVVPDASVVKYVVDLGGKVYLRNLNEVDPTWAGCCSNFWMDITTDVGRAQFSAFLTARAIHQRIMFYVSSKAGPVAFLHVGDF
ncbi:MAG: hypothetical protein JF570_02190 [Caulobacter sp.]|nr:hypothetical protein [Caulobacter sp.]